MTQAKSFRKYCSILFRKIWSRSAKWHATSMK